MGMVRALPALAEQLRAKNHKPEEYTLERIIRYRHVKPIIPKVDMKLVLNV